MLKTFRESTELPWPPTADVLERQTEEDPPDESN